MRKKIAIFISGAGSNMLALIKQVKNKELSADIAYIISNNPKALGLKRAQDLGMKTQVISWQKENICALAQQLKNDDIDYIILAGFMCIIPPYFIKAFPQQIINLHPSLLPRYKGLNAIEKTFESGDEYGGISIHYADDGIDTGPLIAQFKVRRYEDDDIEDFSARIHACEHQNYGKILQQIFTGALKI